MNELIDDLKIKLESFFRIIPGYFNIKQEILDLVNKIKRTYE